jgi:hypothetical protein
MELLCGTEPNTAKAGVVPVIVCLVFNLGLGKHTQVSSCRLPCFHALSKTSTTERNIDLALGIDAVVSHHGLQPNQGTSYQHYTSIFHWFKMCPQCEVSTVPVVMMEMPASTYF